MNYFKTINSTTEMKYTRSWKMQTTKANSRHNK